MKLARFAGLALLACGGMAPAAETAYSEPALIYTVKVPGPASTPGTLRTYLGVQLHPGTIYLGMVASTDGNSFEAEGIDDPASLSFYEPGRAYHVHVLAGNGRGKVLDITGFTSGGFLCSEPVSPWMEAGTIIRIRPHPRISDIFGADNRFGFTAADDPEEADNVVFWDSEAQHERVFHFHATRGRWEEAGIAADAGGTPVRFPYGLYIVRRTPGTVRMSLSGETGGESVLLPVRQGLNVFSLPVNLSCSLDAVIPGSGNQTVVSGPNAASADLLTLEEPTTHLSRGPFYHLARGGATGWREVGVDDSDAPLEPLDFLSTLVIQRSGPPGYVLAEGSLEPPATPRPPLPPDPEAGEGELTGEFPAPLLPPGVGAIYSVETSTDFQNWSVFSGMEHLVFEPGVIRFTLPAGQTRAFYRLALIPEF